MRNRANRADGPTTVYAKFKVEVYVPACQEELRRHYVDPLKYIREQEGEIINLHKILNLFRNSTKFRQSNAVVKKPQNQ